MHRTLGMMAKYWEPGCVKTRLGNSLHCSGPSATDPMQAAAKIHQVFVHYLLEQLHQSADLLELIVSPRHRRGDFQAALESIATLKWQLVDQGEGDLGARMSRWFTRHLQPLQSTSPLADAPPPAARACILIGADCPLLAPADLEAAWTELATHDLVLGPAVDGGYYLIGMSRRSVSSRTPPAPWAAGLFENIPWSTGAVFGRTVAAAEAAGLSIAVLPPRHDVDTADDLQTLLATLRHGGDPNHPLFQTLGAMKIV